MERFELARSDEERKDRFRTTIEFLSEHGLDEEWRLGEIVKEPDSDFGLNNPMPDTNSYQERVLSEKFATRSELIKQYKAISDTFHFLLDKEADVWSRLADVSSEICDMEGHRLSSQSYKVVVTEGKEVKASYWVRRCVVCGKEISASTMTYRDCVVKGEEGPRRVLEQYTDKKK